MLESGSRMSGPEIVLWLFVVVLGVVCGAGIYEARVVLPLWTHTVTGAFQWNSDLSRRTDAARFWTGAAWVVTILVLASLYFAWHEHGARGDWWLAAAALMVVERIADFAYFVPAMRELHRVTPGNLRIDADINRWMLLNHLRNGVVLAAWLMALKALTL